MNIAIIGTGNVGGALALQWARAGHHIVLGVRDTNSFKGMELLKQERTRACSLAEAARVADVILVAIPPVAATELPERLGDLSGKIVIDATNAVFQKPEGYKTVFHLLAEKTQASVVKCFNTTGFENMLNPVYQGVAIDLFMAGDEVHAKSIARQLAQDAGFGDCIDFGGSDKVELLEQFALCWINLAIMQKQGRDIAFRLLRR